MPTSWQELTRLTQGRALVVERVRLADADVAVEGRFELPALAALPGADQVFVAAFVRCHGSIKQMAEWFGVSYPTIKNRLRRLSAALEFAEAAPQPPADVLGRLDAGELTVEEALRALEADKA